MSASWLGWWERPLARLARRKNLAVLAAAALPLVARALLVPWFAAPEPLVHDEFTFLFGADTFAHGRLVNPTHPFWAHFENMHILSRPVHASAFPIGQSAALAAGQALFGHPWYGVWLGCAFMCGAICWMLQGWTRPRWALLGALLVIFRLGIPGYWMNSYWGGCLAAGAGALVLGALPRIKRAPHWSHGVTMGAGLAILAHTRPFEGAVLGALVAASLIVWMLRRDSPPARVVLGQVVLPLALVAGFAAGATFYYFARVTGSPLLAPYSLYRSEMAMAPHFIWQAPRPEPLYNSWEMRNFYANWEMDSYRSARTVSLRALWRRMGDYWLFYLGPLLTLPLITVPALWRDRRTRPLLWMAAVFILALGGEVWHLPHYAAPATGLAFLIVIRGMRNLRAWRRRWPLGLWIVRLLPVACLALLLVQIGAGPARSSITFERSWRWPGPGGIRRAAILRQLRSAGGTHLVFVRSGPRHDPGYEWVYNDADIDHSPVVWVRELDPAGNAGLMRYFAGRSIWLVEPDLPSPRLTPYRDAPSRPMRFVQPGAPGIAVLRSPDEVRRRILAQGAAPGELLDCYQWNFRFTEATGVQGPEDTRSCGEQVSFERWFAWLARQR